MKYLFLFGFLLFALPAFADDDKLLTPYPGSILIGVEAFDYQSFEIPLGPTKDDKLSRSLAVEGKRTRILYQNPEGRSGLEIYRNYEAALKKAGFQTIYACAGPEAKVKGLENCGNQIGNAGGFSYWPYGINYYLATRKSQKGEDIWVVLDVTNIEQKIFVLRPKAMEIDKVEVNADALKNSIEEEGHVAVYGIQFDTNLADLKPSSAPILAEIAKLLKATPKLSIYVVGHTDGVGNLDSNLGLSQRRAIAVTKELVSRYGIAANRLSPQGVGPLVPLASNGNDKGRAKNRRVDLVKQ